MGAALKYDKDAVKAAARGRMLDLLSDVAGISRDRLDGQHHPCPWCNGDDRFQLVDENAGAVLCRKCFASGNGDFLAAIKHGAKCSFPQALAKAADYLGVQPINGVASSAEPEDAVESICRQKKISVASVIAYGARLTSETTIAFPSWGPDGEGFAPFTISATGSEKARKGLWSKGSKGKCGVFLPVVDGKPRLPAEGETWLVFEGPKDPCAAHALGYLAVGLNTCRLAQRFVKLFRGVNVILVPDRDSGGVNGFEDAARKLRGVVATGKTAILPEPIKESKGADFRDVLAKENGKALAREAIEQAAEWKLPDSEGVDTRPRIYNSVREHEVADEAVKALADLPGLYQRGGSLVSIVCDAEPPPGIIRPPGSLYLAAIDEAGTLDRLSQAAQFYVLKETDDGPEEVDIPVPLRIAKIVRSRQRWPGVPAIEGIIHAPAFLADGSVLTTRGYDRTTGLYLAGNTEFPAVSQSPTKMDAEKARDELLEVVCDFPFATDAHRAAWLAMAITPAARFAFDGPAPLGAFDANVRGSGKSKLADSIGMIHLGNELPRTTAPANDEEFRKRITATLLGGDQIVLFDNVAVTLGCPSLDALLTGSLWTDRILGASKTTGRLVASTIWLASGNNLVFGADTARRVLVCRIESREENPEEREGFRHANLLGWVKQNRARLAVAAVTILRAFHVAGRPNGGLPQWGSFNGWSDLVRGAIVFVGMEDPGATRIQVREESDLEAGFLRQLISAWELADATGFGLTVPEAIAKAADGNELLQNVFAEIGKPGKPPSPRGIGQKLRHLRGRVCRGKWFARREGSGHTVYWRVEAATEQSESKESSESIPSPSYAGAHTPAHARTDARAESESTLPTHTTLTCDHPAHYDLSQAREWPSLFACPKCEATVQRKEGEAA